jgi:predicted DNA-binding transcriptional regulator YafY
MDKVISKLKRTLRQAFKDAEIELPPPEKGEKVSGFLVWEGFEGDDQLRRQQRLWEVLDEALTSQERQKISAIFTTTPSEMAVMREG